MGCAVPLRDEDADGLRRKLDDGREQSHFLRFQSVESSGLALRRPRQIKRSRSSLQHGYFVRVSRFRDLLLQQARPTRGAVRSSLNGARAGGAFSRALEDGLGASSRAASSSAELSAFVRRCRQARVRVPASPACASSFGSSEDSRCGARSRVLVRPPRPGRMGGGAAVGAGDATAGSSPVTSAKSSRDALADLEEDADAPRGASPDLPPSRVEPIVPTAERDARPRPRRRREPRGAVHPRDASSWSLGRLTSVARSIPLVGDLFVTSAAFPCGGVRHAFARRAPSAPPPAPPRPVSATARVPSAPSSTTPPRGRSHSKVSPNASPNALERQLHRFGPAGAWNSTGPRGNDSTAASSSTSSSTASSVPYSPSRGPSRRGTCGV